MDSEQPSVSVEEGDVPSALRNAQQARTLLVDEALCANVGAPSATGRPRASWADQGPATVPKYPVSDEEIEFHLPGVKVPKLFREMIDSFAINDVKLNGSDDKYCMFVKSSSEVARRWLHSVVLPKTLEFSVISKQGRDKPMPPDFHLHTPNAWYSSRINQEPLRSRLINELVSEWEGLVHDNYVSQEVLRVPILGGAVHEGTDEAPPIQLMETQDTVYIYKLHRDLFVARNDERAPGGKDTSLVLKCLKDVQPKNPTHLLTAHIAAGGEGSGEVVAVTIGFFMGCIRECAQ